MNNKMASVAAIAWIALLLPADAAPWQIVYTGTIVGTENTVDTAGLFGVPGGDFTGASYSAKFLYDLDSLGPVFTVSDQFNTRTFSNSIYWGEITINGHTFIVDGFGTAGDVISAVWDVRPDLMFGKNFSAGVTDVEPIGNGVYRAELFDQVFSDQIPPLTLTTAFSSDNANFPPTDDFTATGHFSFATFGTASDYEEFFDFLSNRVTVSPVVAAVPEPFSLTMFGAGLVGLTLLGRRKGARASAHK